MSNLHSVLRPYISADPEKATEQLLRLSAAFSESAVQCLQRFSDLYDQDLRYDLHQYSRANQLQTILARLRLPVGTRTEHITALGAHHWDPALKAQALHRSVFSWGNNTILQEEWEDGEMRQVPKLLKGPGVGVVVNTHGPLSFGRNTGYTPRFRFYIHWPSVLMSSRDLFALYPPAVFLALAALPVIRTYSLVLYEYLLRQCASTFYVALRDSGYFGRLDDVEIPLAFQDLVMYPLMDELTTNLRQYYLSPRRDGSLLEPGLHDRINQYLREAVGGAAGRLPRNSSLVSPNLWDDSTCFALKPAAILAREDHWHPYFNASHLSDKMLKPLQPLTDPAMRALWSHKTYIPTQGELPQPASAPKPTRCGYVYSVATNDYVTEFLMEIGRIAKMTGLEDSVPFIRCWCTPPNLEARTLHDYFAAVNWQRAKKVFPFFFLQGQAWKLGDEFLSQELNYANRDALDALQGEMVHPTPHSISEAVETALGAASAEGVPYPNYVTYPMDQFRSHLLRRDVDDHPQRLLRKRYAKQTDFVRRLHKRIRVGREAPQMFRVVNHTEDGLTATILVMLQYEKNHRPHLNFSFLDEEFRCDDSNFFKGPGWGPPELREGVIDGAPFWNNVPDEARDAAPYMATYDLAITLKAPWAHHPRYKVFIPFLRRIRAYTTDQLYRWMMYDDPSIKLQGGRPAKIMAKATQDIRLCTLIRKYLRPGMSQEDYKLLCTFSNSKNPRADIAARATLERAKLFAAGEKDVSKFPLKQFDIRFRREYYQKYGISLSKDDGLPLPEGYTSIREMPFFTGKEQSGEHRETQGGEQKAS